MENGSECEEGGLIEQIPEYTLNTLDDGACEKLILVVQLPGVESSAGLSVHAKDRRIHLHLPGRYKLNVPLGVEVAEKALKLRFVKAKQKLRAEYEVIGRAAQPASLSAQSAHSNGLDGVHTKAASSADPEAGQAQRQKDHENGVHDSFLQDALRLQQINAARASKRALRDVKIHRLPNGGATVTFMDQKSTGVGAPLDANSSSRAVSDGPLTDSKLSSRLKPEVDQRCCSAQQNFSSAAAHQAVNGSKQSSEKADGSHQLHSSSRDGHDAVAWVTNATEGSSDKTASSLNGATPESTSGQDSGSLYDAARVHGNREAAAQCASKAEEAMQERDFDKAERLYARAARLAPGDYEEAAARVAGERAEYELFQAEQAREAKRLKREAEKRKREADRRRRQQESQAQEARAQAEAAARAEAEAQRDSDEAHSGTWEDWSEEPGSARSNAPRPEEYQETYHWGLPLGPFQTVLSVLYGLFSWALLLMQAQKFAIYLEGLRHGSNPQRASLAAGVLMAWALALRIFIALLWWFVPLVWAVWRAVFWRPSLTAALIELVIAVCLIAALPAAVGDLFLMPLMWYWVGGGWPALFGTASCLASIFLIMDPDVIKPYPWVRTYTLPIHLTTPLAYTLLARWTGWVGQTLWVAFTAWRIWRIVRRAPTKAEIPPGMVGTPSCGPEPVPSGAVPEVAKVLQTASWYEVLEVSTSATSEEIKRAHKLKSLGTHPDKVGAANSGAHEASVRVNMAREVLLSEDKRQAYDAEMKAAESSVYTEADPWQGSSSMPGRRTSNGGNASSGYESMFHDYQGHRVPCTNSSEHSNPDCVCMPCQCCPRWHHVHVTKRPRHAAYYCQDCRRYHAATERQFWRESGLGAMLGLSSQKYFLYLNGAVLDITDVMLNCEAWSFIASHCPAPRCVDGMTFKGNFLPVREECFAAWTQAGETYHAQAHTRSSTMPRNNKRKARRKR